MRHLSITLLALAAILVSALSLQSIIAPGWLFTFTLVLLLVGFIGGGARLIAARYGKNANVLAFITSSVFGCWMILTMFGIPSESYSMLPTLDSVPVLANLYSQALFEVQTTSAPLELTTALQLLLFSAGIALFILADALGNSKVPYLVVLPILAFWYPALGLGWAISRFIFGATLLTVLLMLLAGAGLKSRVKPARAGVRPGGAALQALRGRRLVATLTVIGALVAGVAGNAYAARNLDRHRLLPSYRLSSTGRIGSVLNTSQALGTRSDEVLFNYLVYGTSGNTVSLKPGISQPFRVATYADFDGRSWSVLPADLLPETTRETVSDRLIENIEVPPDTAVEMVAMTFVGYTDERLPITSEPRKISGEGKWSWQLDAANDIAYPTNPLKTGMQLALYQYPRDLSTATLRQASLESPNDSALPNAYFEVPNRNARKIVKAAEDIAGAANNRLDKTIAIGKFLSDPRIFTYSTTPPTGNSGNLVFDLLENKSGYCVHFATTMVILARALDIPARLAVGFLPGNLVTDAKWEVRSTDAHAWAEIYFGPEIGWVPFDPTPPGATPGQRAGTMLAFWDHDDDAALLDGEYIEYLADSSEILSPDDDIAGAQVPTSVRGDFSDLYNASLDGLDVAAPQLSQTGGLVRNHWQYWVLAAMVLVLAGSILGIRRWQHRRQHLDEETAWLRATTALGRRGIEVRTTTTPRQLEAAVVAGWERKYQAEPPLHLLAALNTISTAVEAARYRELNNQVPVKELPAALKVIKESHRLK